VNPASLTVCFFRDIFGVPASALYTEDCVHVATYASRRPDITHDGSHRCCGHPLLATVAPTDLEGVWSLATGDDSLST
jgi:hypothetical protein